MRSSIDFSESPIGNWEEESNPNEFDVVPDKDDVEAVFVARRSAGRTKALLLAAIRVWELRRGIKDQD